MASHNTFATIGKITHGSVRVSSHLLVVLALLGLTGFGRVTDKAQVTPYHVKAAFLYNFALFTEWPKESFKDKHAPFVVAVVGEDPFGKILDKTFEKKKVKGRAVDIVRFKKVDDIGQCHILFVPAAEAPQMDAIKKQLATQHALIVGETKDFALRGGSVNFYEREKTIAFEVNPKAVKRAKLSISSRLLKLARIVEEKEKNDDKKDKKNSDTKQAARKDQEDER